jgi:glutamine synthetase
VFSGGTYVCWGSENREVPIRLCNPTEPASRNFEIKTLDGTANPYYALAAILGAGAVGVNEGRELQLGDCNGLSAAGRGEEGRKALGITQRMPLSWQEARENLRKSEVVKSVLGEGVVDAYLRVNKVGLSFNVCFSRWLMSPLSSWLSPWMPLRMRMEK